MPTPKKGLSPLARAQFSLGAKQLRRSMHESHAQKTAVSQKLRDATVPQKSAPQEVEKETENPPQSKTETDRSRQQRYAR
jgi:hypothetical protein